MTPTFAFLIVLTIVLPNQESHSFKVYSKERSGETFCIQNAKEAAQRYVEYARRKIRLGSITAEASCEPNPSRFI